MTSRSKEEVSTRSIARSRRRRRNLLNRTVDDVGEDLKLAVRVRGKTTSWEDSVLVDHVQRPPMLLAREGRIVVREIEGLQVEVRVSGEFGEEEEEMILHGRT